MTPNSITPLYDYDVAVIGAGPAGMTAAIRTRWVKSYKSVPCSTVLFDRAGLGGLAKWRSCMLTGPSFHLMGKDVVARFKQDIDDLEIPLIASRVVKVALEGTVKTIVTESGDSIRALAVIIATGFRSLCNEHEYLKNIAITYMGYEFFEELLNNLFTMKGKQTVLIVGNEFTRNLVDLIETCNQGRQTVLYLIDAHAEKPLWPAPPGTVLQGKIVRYEGKESLEGVKVVLKGGEETFIACQKVLLDYNSYELAPLYEFDAGALKKDGRGFIMVDREMRTNIPGVYAAGDVTGLYATVGRAIGDGIVAGFSAYKDIFRRKFNHEPCLFAYAAQDIKITPGFKDLPRPSLNLRPKLLISAERAARYLDEYATKTSRKLNSIKDMLNSCAGIDTLQEHLNKSSLEEQHLLDAIEFLLEKKAVALHL
ncbi:MAG: NAD(P)/FAD-dependent oxidoreductase [Proteobacteria bacterium]|nr:NAD(P)/FAD-dependent oxidoreductase [Pseudomonadota bacterium]